MSVVIFLGLYVLLISGSFYILQKVARAATGALWHNAQIKLTFNVGICGIILLVLHSFTPNQFQTHVPNAMEQYIKSKETFKWHDTKQQARVAFTRDYDRLKNLSNTLWFVQNLPIYVLLPAALTFLFAYRPFRGKSKVQES